MKWYALFFASLFLLPAQAFTTLDQAHTYAKAIMMNTKTHFDGDQFKKLLSRVLHTRENIGYSGRFAVKITPYPDTTFIVWGPLKGSFVSFLDTLEYLKSTGVINSSFKLLNPSTYLVFNGDVVSGSDYSLETLLLLLSLMDANPKNVFYLKGTDEDNLRWHDESIKQELKSKISSAPSISITLIRLMTNFFNTLPLALYITGLIPKDGSIRLSHFSRDVKEIDETACGLLFIDKTLNTPQICYFDTAIKGPETVKALVKSEQRLMSYLYHPGLLQVEPDKGAVSWSIFSAPSEKYQTDYQFYANAFTTITTGKTIDDAVISLYKTDVRTQEPIRLIASYNLLTGVPVPLKKSPTKPIAQTLQSSLRSLYSSIDQLLTEVTRLNETLTNRKLQRRAA